MNMKRLWQFWLARIGRRPVYTAAAWWRDCEPFAGVVALTRSMVDDKINDAMREEMDAYDYEYAHEAEMCWSGVFAEKVSVLVLNAEQMRDLRVDGYCWQETP